MVYVPLLIGLGLREPLRFRLTLESAKETLLVEISKSEQRQSH